MKFKNDFKDFSRKGGLTTKARYGSEHYKRIRLIGNETIKRKYGREFFVRMGKLSAEKRKREKEEALKTPIDRFAEVLSGKAI